VDQRTRWEIGGGLVGIAVSGIGLGATMTGYVNPVVGWTLVSVGAALFFGAVAFTCWPWLHRLGVSARRRLRVDPMMNSPSDLYPRQPGRGTQLIDSALRKRAFAILKVRNEGKRDLHRVVPVCVVKGSNPEITLPCFWAKDQDGSFSPGGGPSADLSVWHVRVLVIAQVFGEEKLWARLPVDQANLMPMPAFRDRGIAERIGDARLISLAGERLDLGETLQVTVSFRAERFRQTELLLLSFGADGPTISRLS